MIKVFAKLDCGCCTSEMSFNSLESANEAFNKVGFGNGMCITDDAGEVHFNLDTFYGFSTDEGEQSDKALDYLSSIVPG